MRGETPIHVRDVQELRTLMEAEPLGVVWQVWSDIGPGWIGGGRRVRWWLGKRELVEGPVRDRLTEALVEALAIPDSGGDAVFKGEGTGRWEGERLVVTYDWDATVPYMDPHEEGEGEVVLEGLAVEGVDRPGGDG